MPYSVVILPAARRDFDKLSRDVQTRVLAKLDALSADPFPAGVRKIAGHRNRYRVRVGDHRILFEVNGATEVVTIVAVGLREHIYTRRR